MTAVTRKDVEYIASLAKLRLDEEEVPVITDQLNRILEYVEHLNELDTSDVEPLAHPLELQNVFREDEKKPSLKREEALKNAPKRAGDYFSVPKVVRK
ncbi:Asp-tRNA(Asn)/Glu-tRNA(Gln) amidotransferase subunit GatC [Calditrichota bacterium LG25]